jgi:hypothetical protein
MSTDTTATTGIQRPPTFFYIGRPASLYIEAIGRRRPTRPAVASSPGEAEKQSTTLVDGRQLFAGAEIPPGEALPVVDGLVA